MKIAYLGRYPPAECGIAEYTWFLVEEMRRVSGVEIVVLGNEDVPREAAFSDNVRVLRVFRSASSDYSRVLEALREIRPDILHIQHDYSFFPQSIEFLELLRRCREMGIRIVVTMHTVKAPTGIARAVAGETTFSEGARQDFELIMFQRKLVELSDAVIVHSYLQEHELWIQGVDIEKVVIVPHGTLINPHISRDRRAVLEELRRAGIDLGEGMVISLPGFVRPDKGLDIALKAFDIVSRRIDAVLVMGGAPQGAGSEKLRDALAQVAGRRSRVVFVDRFIDRDTMLKILAASHVVVLPYREVRGLIGVSGVLHLAMGSFRPMVCTRVPRLVEYCERVPHLCARQGDFMEFSYKLMNLLENLENYRRDLEPVWRYALDTSWSRVARKHVEVYESVLKR